MRWHVLQDLKNSREAYRVKIYKIKNKTSRILEVLFFLSKQKFAIKEGEQIFVK